MENKNITNEYELIVCVNGNKSSIRFEPGFSLRDILNTSEHRTRSACRGNGACGLCRVKIVRGPVTPVSQIEEMHLAEKDLHDNIRLACRVWPEADLEVELLNPAPPSIWRSLPEQKYVTEFTLNGRSAGQRRYGVAIDLGTTHLSVALCDLKTGERLETRFGPNPQSSQGTDILNRLVAASESADLAAELQQVVIEAISDALMDISVREGRSLYDIAKVRIVGNSAMLALLASENYQHLLNPESWMLPFSVFFDKEDEWTAQWNMDTGVDIALLQPLAGFVGSDIGAGLVHTKLVESQQPVLFIDVGTNSEVALWDGEHLLLTSAAGGPAFEGMGISCGMPAETGAIYSFSKLDGTCDYQVYGNTEARGICGSGLIDLTALLIKKGMVNPLGGFLPELKGQYQIPGTNLFVSKQDVDLLQRAKGAIGGATLVLLHRSGLGFDDLDQVLVAGVFGRYLNFQHAIDLGLLPPLNPNRIHAVGNTALMGCQDVLLSDQAKTKFDELHDKIEIINLSAVAEMQEVFLESLYLRPQTLDWKN